MKLQVVDAFVKTKPSLMNPRFVYTKGSNVQAIWRRHGWVPPTEYRNDYEFKKNREGKNT